MWNSILQVWVADGCKTQRVIEFFEVALSSDLDLIG